MTADVELLPLPSVLLNWPHPTNHAAIRDYARACVAHAAAARDAEIEALRAEVDEWRQAAITQSGEMFREKDRAEQLAEAAEKVLIAASARNVLAMFQAAEALGAALEQENGHG